MSKDFSHLDAAGNPSMVDVGAKPPTRRTAIARCTVVLDEAILRHFANDDIRTKKDLDDATAKEIAQGTKDVKAQMLVTAAAGAR